MLVLSWPKRCITDVMGNPIDTSLIPREHGAWALLATSCAVGATISHAQWGLGFLFYAGGVLSLFVSRPGLERTLKRGPSLAATGFSGLCAALGSAFFAAFAVVYGRYEILFWVFPLLVVAAIREGFVRKFGPRSLWAHGASVAAMALLVPATAHAFSGSVDSASLGLGVVSFAYFFGPVFIVRAVLARTGTFQASAYFGVFAILFVGFSWVLAIPFFARAVEACDSHPRPLDLKAVGWSEVGWTILFLVCVFLSVG